MENYVTQKSSLWRFEDRGSWCTHSGSYRGNWSPHIPRNLILKYSKEDDVVVDLFVGGGTTLIETKLLNRYGIGVDINKNALLITEKNLDFKCNTIKSQKLLCESAISTSISTSSVDLICMHPPYADIIKYSDNIKGDLSLLSVDEFIKEWDLVAKECRRILKKGKKCCYMIGDCRKNGHVIPLGFKSLEVFLNNGFILKEIIIKEQFNCKSTDYWMNKCEKMGFYLLAHEYIFVFSN